MTRENPWEVTTHIVVFDVNVYLDIASLLGPPFSWSALSAHAARISGDPVPHPSDPRHDSLRAVSGASSGKFAGRHPLQVWTSAHIDGLVRHKACQPDDDALYPEDRGLGWSEEQGQGLVDDLVWGAVETTAGDTVGCAYPYGDPPLSHEDGLVYGACKEAFDQDLLCERYCVTNDRDFLRQELPGHVRVLRPAQFVRLLRAARTSISVNRMRPPDARA